MIDLASLGWNADLAATFVEQAGPGVVPGRVSLEHNHVYRVLTAEGEWLAEATGRLKHRAAGRHELPAVGDWVGIRPGPSNVEGPSAEAGRGTISLILPRRSCFSRRAAGRTTEEQVIAANIDYVFLVASLEIERVKLRSLERYLVLARQSGAAPVVILNKTDLVEDLPAVIASAVELAGDVPVHAISAKDGNGFEWLDRYLAVGRTVALLGPSGAGKSTIVNRLAGRELVATGEVRERDLRGRHTSVHRQMLVLDCGGILIDTPGMRELALWETEGSLDDVFADVDAFAGGCRFRDCRHDREPGCAVKAAVDEGTLDPERDEVYRKLTDEREALADDQAKRALLDEKKRSGRPGGKASREMPKDRGRPS